MSEKLKPCPHCGGAPTLVEDKDEQFGIEDYYVRCMNEYCAAKPETASFHKRESAITAWNIRADCAECHMGAKPMTDENMAAAGWIRERTCRIETRDIDGIEEEFCTACGNEVACYYRPHYCPNCGAKVVE